jgi:glycine/D-amino acid oxidase-like deaminating enzyme
VAHGSVLDHPVTPSSFRWLARFLPAVRKQSDVVKLSLGKHFFEELLTPKRWRLDGVSPFERTRVLDPAPNPHTLKQIRRELGALFPALADVEFVEAWAGMIESTPDIVPVIDEIERLPGFFVASGFSGHGFGIGPGAGKAIAGLLTDRDTGIDIAPLCYDRFFDGSPMQLQGAI